MPRLLDRSLVCVAGAILIAWLALLGGCGGDEEQGPPAAADGEGGPGARDSTGPGRGASPPDGKAGPGGNGGDRGGERADSAGGGGEQEDRARGPAEAERGAEGERSGAPATGAPLQASRFVKAADAICARTGRKVRRAVEARVRGRLPEVANSGTAERIVEEVWAPMLDAEIGELEALDGPPAAEAALRRVTAGMAAIVEEARAEPREFALTSRPFAQPERLARKYGFSKCGGV